MNRASAMGIVWGVWGLMTAAAFAMVALYGPHVPIADTMDQLLPLSTGHVSLTFERLWRAGNNHHAPIPRGILLALAWATDHNFRMGMYFNVGVLSAVSALLIATAKSIRGRLQWTDAMIPILLLNWGHYSTFLWSIQIVVALIAVFSCVLLTLIARESAVPSGRTIGLATLCLLCMPICQAAGVALSPPIALWLIAVGVTHWRTGERHLRRVGLFALVAGVGVIAFALFCYVGPKSHEPTSAQLQTVAWNSIRLLCMSFGRITEGPHPIFTTLMLVWLMLSSLLLFDVWRHQPEERLRSWGLFLYLNAFVVMALGIAWARPRTIIDRFPILVAPFLCGMYFVWLIYGRDRRGEQVCAVLCAMVLVFTPIRTFEGWRWASERFQQTQVFREELRAGMPLSALVERHTMTIHPNPRSLRMMLLYLHEAQIGEFRYLNVDEDESVNTPSSESKPMRGE